MFRTLADHGINLRMISTSPIKISLHDRPRRRSPTAVRALHAAFELETAPTRRTSVTRLAVLGATGAVGDDAAARARGARRSRSTSCACSRRERSAGADAPLPRRGRRGAASRPRTRSTASTSRSSRPARRARARSRPLAVAAGARRDRQLVGVPHGSPRCRSSCPRSTRRPRFAHAGVIANPNCSTMQLVPGAEAAARRRPALEHVTVSTYQSVSGTGQKAIDALRRQSAAALAGEDSHSPGSPSCANASGARRRSRLPLPGISAPRTTSHDMPKPERPGCWSDRTRGRARRSTESADLPSR